MVGERREPFSQPSRAKQMGRGLAVVQDQSAVRTVAALGSDGPNVVGRRGCRGAEDVVAGPRIRAGYYVPAATVPLLGQGANVAVSVDVLSDRPGVRGRNDRRAIQH